jgi:cell division GTPase FtsZ
MGGGTGTGAAPVVAQLAKEKGILTVAVVTRPFVFEGKKRIHVADQGIRELSELVDSLIIIPNEKILEVMGGKVTLLDAFATANEVLLNAVQGIAELITRPGLINVDFADVRTVIKPGRVISSAIPCTAFNNTSLAVANASKSVTLPPITSRIFSFGIMISESTSSLSSRMPWSAT